jgi:hypothetical protein
MELLFVALVEDLVLSYGLVLLLLPPSPLLLMLLLDKLRTLFFFSAQDSSWPFSMDLSVSLVLLTGCARLQLLRT